ncbi:hypothetical protein C8R45DRAFT_939214 [Mycena sanguinolenta]|nr:hypothetical protein C8R45DRAFT_939214 [Mycena sanguinolenta]
MSRYTTTRQTATRRSNTDPGYSTTYQETRRTGTGHGDINPFPLSLTLAQTPYGQTSTPTWNAPQAQVPIQINAMNAAEREMLLFQLLAHFQGNQAPGQNIPAYYATAPHYGAYAQDTYSYNYTPPLPGMGGQGGAGGDAAWQYGQGDAGGDGISRGGRGGTGFGPIFNNVPASMAAGFYDQVSSTGRDMRGVGGEGGRGMIAGDGGDATECEAKRVAYLQVEAAAKPESLPILPMRGKGRRVEEQIRNSKSGCEVVGVGRAWARPLVALGASGGLRRREDEALRERLRPASRRTDRLRAGKPQSDSTTRVCWGILSSSSSSDQSPGSVVLYMFYWTSSPTSVVLRSVFPCLSIEEEPEQLDTSSACTGEQRSCRRQLPSDVCWSKGISVVVFEDKIWGVGFACYKNRLPTEDAQMW